MLSILDSNFCQNCDKASGLFVQLSLYFIEYDARICLNCPTSHYSNIAIIYDSDLMCIHSLLWKKIVHIIMVYGQRTEARIQYR
ncbi:unnamed protein product, partial [Rotaria magnacalcarata]